MKAVFLFFVLVLVVFVHASNNQANFCDSPSCASVTAVEEEEEVMSYDTLEAQLEQHNTLNFWDALAKFAQDNPKLASKLVKFGDSVLKKVKFQGKVMWKESVPETAVVDMGDRCVSSCEWMAVKIGKEPRQAFTDCEKRYIVFLKPNNTMKCPTKDDIGNAYIADLAGKCHRSTLGGCEFVEKDSKSANALAFTKEEVVNKVKSTIEGALAECYTNQEPKITTPVNLNMGKVCTYTSASQVTTDVPLDNPNNYQVGQKCTYYGTTANVLRRVYKLTNKQN
jgi:hypothetical protein